jgi:hypothetical protein
LIIGCWQSTSQPPRHLFRSSLFPSFLLRPNLMALLGSGRLYSRAVPLGCYEPLSSSDTFCLSLSFLSFLFYFRPTRGLFGWSKHYLLSFAFLFWIYTSSIIVTFYILTSCEDSVDQSLHLKLHISLSLTASNHTPSRLNNHRLLIFHHTLPSV